MLKIDIHTHIMPPKLPAWNKQFGYDGFMTLNQCSGGCQIDMKFDDGRFFRRVDQNCWDPEERLRDMDLTDINIQVLSTIPVLFSYWAKAKDAYDIHRFLNDHLAEIIYSYPSRFCGLGVVPLQDPELAAKECKRCVRELGLQGIEIGTHLESKNLDDESFYPLYEVAEKEGAAIFVHPWDMMGKNSMPNYWLPWLVGMPAETSRAICSMIFGGIFDKFPKLRLAFAHGGGSFPGTLGRISHGYKVRPDLCAQKCLKAPHDYLGKFYLDTLVHDNTSLENLINLVGKDSLALGSDYPFPLGEHHPGKLIESLALNNQTKERLLSGTALEWLGVKKERFL